MRGLDWAVGGSTWGFFRPEDRAVWTSVSEAVRAIGRSGLGVEVWPTRSLHDAAPSDAEVDSIRQALAEVPFASVHIRGRFWSWRPIDLRSEIDFADQVGARTLVIHPVCFGLERPGDRFDAEEVARIARYGADRDVRLALENVRNASWALDRVLDEIGDDPGETNLGVCVDVGHAFLSDDLGEEPVRRYVERYRSQLVHLHLHDNAGVEDDPGERAVLG